MFGHEPGSPRRRTLLAGFATLAASAVIGDSRITAAIEQSTLKLMRSSTTPAMAAAG
jgi:hypothetical protein